MAMAASSAAGVSVGVVEKSWISAAASPRSRPRFVVAVSNSQPSSPAPSSSSSASSESSSVPKLEPFSQSRSVRGMRQRTLLEKAEHALQDECTLLDGDEAYECYDALFEFETIKEKSQEECAASLDDDQRSCHPLERLENLVRQSGGVTTLIKNLTVLAGFNRKKGSARSRESSQAATTAAAAAAAEKEAELFLEPDSIPKSAEELAEEERAKLPESPLSRLLKRRGLPSLWFGQRPEHETD